MTAKMKWRIAKKILEKVNTAVRTKSGLKQWTSTGDAVKWFKNIERKTSKKFIVCDVVNFYPTIKEELLRNSLIWAHQYIEISDEEISSVSRRLISQPWSRIFPKLFISVPEEKISLKGSTKFFRFLNSLSLFGVTRCWDSRILLASLFDLR